MTKQEALIGLAEVTGVRIEGCCDDPACPYCFGSGIFDPSDPIHHDGE